jgi:plastocyanin
MKKATILTLVLMTFVIPAYAGTVTGKASFTGTAPERTAIATDADPVCSGLNPEPLLSEDVIVNDNQTLQNVFVYVKEGLEGKTFPAPAEAVVMDQSGCHYVPHVFGVQVGQPLEIKNSDSTLHNVHGMPKNSKEFNLGMPIVGMKLKRTFEKPEIMVKFKCDVHPWMNAYIGVTDHPFFDVTDEQGNFEIKDLPPGDYVLEAWHEKFGTQTQNVTVPAEGAPAADFSFQG